MPHSIKELVKLLSSLYAHLSIFFIVLPISQNTNKLVNLKLENFLHLGATFCNRNSENATVAGCCRSGFSPCYLLRNCGTERTVNTYCTDSIITCTALFPFYSFLMSSFCLLQTVTLLKMLLSDHSHQLGILGCHCFNSSWPGTSALEV